MIVQVSVMWTGPPLLTTAIAITIMIIPFPPLRFTEAPSSSGPRGGGATAASGTAAAADEAWAMGSAAKAEAHDEGGSATNLAEPLP